MRNKLVVLALIVALLVSAGAAALEAVASDEADGLDGSDGSDGSDGLILWKQECPAHLGKVEVVDMGTSLLVMCLAVD